MSFLLDICEVICPTKLYLWYWANSDWDTGRIIWKDSAAIWDAEAQTTEEEAFPLADLPALLKTDQYTVNIEPDEEELSINSGLPSKECFIRPYGRVVVPTGKLLVLDSNCTAHWLKLEKSPVALPSIPQEEPVEEPGEITLSQTTSDLRSKPIFASFYLPSLLFVLMFLFCTAFWAIKRKYAVALSSPSNSSGKGKVSRGNDEPTDTPGAVPQEVRSLPASSTEEREEGSIPAAPGPQTSTDIPSVNQERPIDQTIPPFTLETVNAFVVYLEKYPVLNEVIVRGLYDKLMSSKREEPSVGRLSTQEMFSVLRALLSQDQEAPGRKDETTVVPEGVPEGSEPPTGSKEVDNGPRGTPDTPPSDPGEASLALPFIPVELAPTDSERQIRPLPSRPFKLVRSGQISASTLATKHGSVPSRAVGTQPSALVDQSNLQLADDDSKALYEEGPTPPVQEDTGPLDSSKERHMGSPVLAMKERTNVREEEAIDNNIRFSDREDEADDEVLLAVTKSESAQDDEESEFERPMSPYEPVSPTELFPPDPDDAEASEAGDPVDELQSQVAAEDEDASVEDLDHDKQEDLVAGNGDIRTMVTNVLDIYQKWKMAPVRVVGWNPSESPVDLKYRQAELSFKAEARLTKHLNQIFRTQDYELEAFEEDDYATPWTLVLQHVPATTELGATLLFWADGDDDLFRDDKRVLNLKDAEGLTLEGSFFSRELLFRLSAFLPQVLKLTLIGCEDLSLLLLDLNAGLLFPSLETIVVPGRPEVTQDEVDKFIKARSQLSNLIRQKKISSSPPSLDVEAVPVLVHKTEVVGVFSQELELETPPDHMAIVAEVIQYFREYDLSGGYGEEVDSDETRT